MKFYLKNKNNLTKIINNKLTVIYSCGHIFFFKDGTYHNNKNAAYNSNRYKEFYLDGIHYGSKNKFTKQSWRRFCKLQVFL